MALRSRQAGISSVQVLVSAVIFATVLMASVSYSMTLSNRFSSLRSSAASQSVAQGVLAGIERALYQAEPAVPTAFLVADLNPGDATVSLDRVDGLPPSGWILVRGAGGSERVGYDGVQFVSSTWTLSLTTSVTATHAAGRQVRLAQLGTLDASVTALDAGLFGQTFELTGVREFLGEGSAVVFRRRLPDGSYGAVVDGSPVSGAWQMLAFRPATALVEAEVGRDLNFDGDRADTFDVGRIHRWTWPAHAAGATADADVLAVSPSVVVQERGVWGGDLDSDGSDDPLFAFDPETGVLRMAIFTVLGEGRARRLGAMRATVRLRTNP